MKKHLPEGYKIKLKFDTPGEWVDTVLQDFDRFLIDHADCERKASSMAMSLVAKAPEKTAIIPELIDIALEEMVHFRQVYKLMEHRGLSLPKEMEKDQYIQRLLGACRSDWRNRFLDRLLVASIVETRGAERFRLVSENIGDPDLADYYKTLYQSEDRHGNVFVEMALEYYDREEVMKRLDELVETEAKICRSLPFRPALH